VLERMVEEALVRFDPETAAAHALEALEARHATITLDHLLDTALATGRLDAVLDVADALDLDAALSQLAGELATAGDCDPLPVRRAKALGLLARGETPMLTDRSDGTTPAGAVARRRREVVLHVHLAQAALHGAGDGIMLLSTATGHPLGPVTVEQVQDWCGAPEAAVVVKPVLDLAETLTSSGYTPSPRLREQVIERHRTCVFPHCTRPAERLDLDHIRPYAAGGKTETDNLAPLCRRHHRAKTHGGWIYHRLAATEYLWTSPHGYQWITDPDGTRSVTDTG
jgi:hypothetical protein